MRLRATKALGRRGGEAMTGVEAGLRIAKLEAEVARLREHLEAICSKFSDYEDLARPEELPLRFDDLNNRRIELENKVKWLQGEVKRLRRLHEALLNTLAPSKSTWIQHVVRNARAALATAKGKPGR
jgi:predicted  nucleic acid-binding Zn-ribbon protein